ncbi:hypothetical protein [endosymbiont GvMRE of Glomus versiforme]|uniref:hypothetical protein n=1 Tax=endosymbiont GvMRE of Glomus versiforme TaxID=2039283 RepID=UPI000ED18B22|nr:hypothetical protein [endosymbiont GvMRE of Glomus versiforme]RHZ35327.1 hypothetical protein GvMRE_IIg99 [endosymbiont GvMRE of Glomus versiforme]RHZ35347.1 hypothetical protein GvMRE_IIg85 [endosymbiont GvMRE of Glomus versiforme]
MKKNNIPTYILGLELKKNCPRGVRNRLVKWLWCNSDKRLKRNVYLLRENKYHLWLEYYSPLVERFGNNFAYQAVLN